jgi:hypothetical protein
MVLGVLAEHSLPFTHAPVLIDLAKELSRDPKALSSLSMDRTSASYKMRLGLGRSVLEETVEKLKGSPSSLNMDESTATNFKKIMEVLVSFYDEKEESVVVEHLASLNVTASDAASLSKHNLPWENLISMLLDSCNVMRGSKSGLETRIRKEKAPHLLDKDGDSCHHMHNCAKVFVKPFSNYLESMYNDLYNDCKWSQDLVEALKSICSVLGLNYTQPERFVPHRWLSAYDVTLSSLHLMDAYILFYYAFLPAKDIKDRTYEDFIHAIIAKHNVASAEAKAKVAGVQKVIRGKNMTPEGKERKVRVFQKLLYKRGETAMIMNLYASVLAILKEYVCLFQLKELSYINCTTNKKKF